MSAPNGNNGPTPEYRAKPSIDGSTVNNGNQGNHGKAPSPNNSESERDIYVTDDAPRQPRAKQVAPTGVMVSIPARACQCLSILLTLPIDRPAAQEERVCLF